MTVDEALARLDGTDGKPGGQEVSADKLGDIADVLAAEVRRLRDGLSRVIADYEDDFGPCPEGWLIGRVRELIAR